LHAAVPDPLDPRVDLRVVEPLEDVGRVHVPLERANLAHELQRLPAPGLLQQVAAECFLGGALDVSETAGG
jgi:hypothetical protein